MLPAVDLRHQMAAAMAEIIVKMAVSHLPSSADDQAEGNSGEGQPKEPPVATLDQRLLLSAAIHQLLSLGTSRNIDLSGSKLVLQTPRIVRAREDLLDLLDYYIERLERAGQEAVRARDRNPQFTPELTRRAIMVLMALAESIIEMIWKTRKTR
ncbi:MAG: hypothetical protein ACRDOB_12550 [Streptosporangiaceae bacterium]